MTIKKTVDLHCNPLNVPQPRIHSGIPLDSKRQEKIACIVSKNEYDFQNFSIDVIFFYFFWFCMMLTLMNLSFTYHGMEITEKSGDFYISGGIGMHKMLCDTYCFNRDKCDWIDPC